MKVPPGRTRRVLDRLRGRAVPRDPSEYRESLARIAGQEGELRRLPDASLLRISEELARGLDVSRAFALVREVSRRVLGMRPYDVQILAGLALIDGRLAEMKTGEGKTLAAVAPAFVESLAGRGVHVLTFNDYLARRDAQWMTPIYEFLGRSVRFVQESMGVDERRRAYAADVTYATAKEAGFDYLRGSLCRHPDELVHRPFHVAIVDEADSILIDEARVPLVIAGDTGDRRAPEVRLHAVVRELEPGLHFTTDDERRNVNLTNAGLDRVERRLDVPDLLAPANLETLTAVNCALHAEVLLRKDVDYIVRGGRLELVDELTGRVVEDRHLPDGLQAAVQAKEGLAGGAGGKILGSLTLANFLRLYPKLCGMTATALQAADDFKDAYGLEVIAVPPNRPSIREDHDDVIFTHREAKMRALIEEIRGVHATGRPVLVGTASVDESERLASALRARGVDCRVLNARCDDREAAIVADAGALGAVTISTNMAGRGTDIRLGGRDEGDGEKVRALGGLYVIGTNRHESRRIDDQLRGRAGRQGDPGSTRFFISLEDPLLLRYGVADVIRSRYGPERSEEPVDDAFVRREIRRGQRIVEGEHLELRRTLESYASLVERQRVRLHDRRRRTLLVQADSLLEKEAPDRYAAVLHRHGPAVVEDVERQITLHHIDRIWCEHLAHAADLRESIHLVRVGGRDPLSTFQNEITDAYLDRERELEQAIVRSFEKATIGPGGIDLEREGLSVPSSTWTYLVSDDPFADQLHMRFAGNIGMGAGLVFNLPIVLAWLLYRRIVGRRDGRE